MIIRTVFILLSWSTLCLAVDSSWTTVNSVSDLEGAAAAIFEDIDPEASRDHYDDKWLQKDDWDLNRRPETKETYDWDGQKLDWNRQTADVSVMEQTPKKDKWKNVYHKAATGGRARYHKDGKEKKAGFDKTWDSSDDKVEDEEEEDEPSEAEENAGYKKSAHQPKNVRILRQHQTGFADSDHDEDTNTPTTTMPSRGYGYPPRNARNQQPQPQHSHYRPPLAVPNPHHHRPQASNKHTYSKPIRTGATRRPNVGRPPREEYGQRPRTPHHEPEGDARNRRNRQREKFSQYSEVSGERPHRGERYRSAATGYV